MCTVSILRDNGGLVVTSNRDELRTRDEAGIRQDLSEMTQRIYPIDAQAKGTWLGVNNYGIVASLLNMYEADYQGSLSRGLIIPRLLEFGCLADVREWLAQSFEPSLHSAFVLLLMNKDELYRYRWDGLSFNAELIEFSHSFLESSSSVDLEATVMYRQRLFANWRTRDGSAEDILAFHCQRDEANASKSVCMAREHSHTKSVSQIKIDASSVEFRYLSPERLGPLVNTDIKPNQLESIRCELLAPTQPDEALAKIRTG